MNIDKLFALAVEKKASDLHLVAGLAPMLRIDGELFPAQAEKLNADEIEKMVSAILSEPHREKFAAEKELDVSYAAKNGSRFRVNVRFERGNVALAARVISQDIPALVDINMPAVVVNLLQRTQGLILMTGPTGCGKSTALAAMIEHINQKQARNIITLEDPIEFLFTSKKSIVTQRQLGTDMLSFADGLKHIVRQDPNVIMVGEMRDLETVAAAVTLAETGHLVLATLHTYSAAQTVARITDIFPAYQQGQITAQLSVVLTAVISQRLVPAQSGGRVPAREILLNTPAVANVIRERKASQILGVIETSGNAGMVSMEKALKELHGQGAITKETMRAYMADSLMV